MASTVRGVYYQNWNLQSLCFKVQRDPDRAVSSSGVKWDKILFSSPKAHFWVPSMSPWPHGHATVGHICYCVHTEHEWLHDLCNTDYNIHTKHMIQGYNTGTEVFTDCSLRRSHTRESHFCFYHFISDVQFKAILQTNWKFPDYKDKNSKDCYQIY